MKFNIFLIVFGAALLSLAWVIPAPWSIVPCWFGAVGLINGVFGLCQRCFYGDLR